MKTLPLFYYPSTWVWVDDDRTLLKTMTDTFSEKNRIVSFLSANECLTFLTKHESLLSQAHFLKINRDDEHYGLLQNTPIDFDVTVIAKLAEKNDRHDEVTVAVIDYDMPEMNGFTLAKEIQHLPIQKILFTGNKQDNKAIEGFNHNLIQKFVQKGDVNMFDDLSNYLKELSIQYFQKLTFPLLSYLETEHKLPLSDPVFIDFFESYCESNDVKEYYVIDKQGSFLCIDSQGKQSCLVVHTERSLQQWHSVYGNGKLLQAGEKIPFFGVGKEAWGFEASEWLKYFYEPNVLEGREKYFWFKAN